MRSVKWSSRTNGDGTTSVGGCSTSSRSDARGVPEVPTGRSQAADRAASRRDEQAVAVSGRTQATADGPWQRLIEQHRATYSAESDAAPVAGRIGFLVVMIGLLAIAVASMVVIKGADNWCGREGLDRGGFSSKELGVGLWPPGIRCSFTDRDGSRVDLVWPFDV